MNSFLLNWVNKGRSNSSETENCNIKAVLESVETVDENFKRSVGDIPTM